MGISRISFIILKWLQLKKPLFALNGGRCVAFKIIFFDVSISLWNVDVVFHA